MRPNFYKTHLAANNPIANVLVIVAGSLLIGLFVVLGFFAFLALSALVLVTAAVISVRMWWFKRKLSQGRQSSESAPKTGPGPTGVIEGEYRVIDKSDQD